MTSYSEKFEAEITDFRQNCKKSIEEYGNVINGFKQQYNTTCEELNNCILQIKETLEEIKSIKDDAKDNLSEIKELHNEIQKTRNEILEDDPDDEPAIFTDIKDSQKEIDNIYDKISTYNKEIFGYRKEKLEKVALQIFNSLPDNEKRTKGNEHYKITYENIPGIKDKIQNMINDYANLIKEEKEHIDAREKDITQKNDILYKKINEMLPGVTAAGLAGAYHDAKKESGWRIIFWSCGFIVSLIAFAVVAWTLIRYNVITFTQEMSFQVSVGQLMRAACFELPCIWFAWAANVKVSQYTRLNEEYRHKWAMMRVFDGMRNALEETEDANEDNNVGYFYRVLLDSFSNNPSKTLDKKYSPDGPFSFFDKILKKTEKQNDVDGSNTTNNPQ